MTETIDFRKLILPPAADIRRGISAMTGPGRPGIILVAKKDRRLLGVVVDSDIRKAMLKGLSLDAPLSKIMNKKPLTLRHGTAPDAVARFFRANPRGNVPVVDGLGRIRGIAQMSEYLARALERPNAVVLMAGGEGRRLRPLTESTPKPLLSVGDRPILETIIKQFVDAGFRRFFLAVHRQAGQIRKHLGSGKSLGVDIRYILEKKPLGTAGALSLLPRGLKHPVLVMNADVLTKIDLKALLEFHEEEGNHATLCVREYDFQVPYGVTVIKGHRLLRMVEKPTQRYFVNAGIYVVEPRALTRLRRGVCRDMPEFLEELRKRRPGSVGCFPIREYWIDIGRMDEYQRAQAEYGRHFRP